VIIKANKQVFIDYDINMIDCKTISALAIKIFLNDSNNNNISSITKSSIYKRGLLWRYNRKPSGENLFYSYVNSTYLYVVLQDLPGLKCYL